MFIWIRRATRSAFGCEPHGPERVAVASQGCHGAIVGWFVLAGLLLISAVLNWVQVIEVSNAQIRVFRVALSLVMLFLALLAIRKGLAERADR